MIVSTLRNERPLWVISGHSPPLQFCQSREFEGFTPHGSKFAGYASFG